MRAIRFAVGDRIENSYYCRGRVIEIKGGTMRAEFTERGHSWIETYDAAWFRAYGDLIKNLGRR